MYDDRPPGEWDFDQEANYYQQENEDGTVVDMVDGGELLD